MSALDDLLAARASAGAAAAPASAAGAVPAAAAPAGLDAMLAARAQGGSVAAPPAGDRTFGQSLGDMASAFGHHVMAPLHGAAQFVENTVAAGANRLPDNPVSRAISRTAQSDNQALAKWEKDYQASTPDGWGANAGAIAGTIAPFLLSGPTSALQRLGDGIAAKVFPTAAGAAPSLVAKVASGAAQGAALGAAQPVTDAPTSLADLVTQQQPFDYWGQKGRQVATGAAFGGVLPATFGAAGGAWNSARQAVTANPLLNPATYAARQIAQQLGADAPVVANDLAGAPTYVPGSVPTAAQAGADRRLVMMEKALANQNPKFKEALTARENANNAARLQAVAQVAQTPEALQAAIDSRTAATAPMRARVVDNGNPVPVAGVSGALSSVADGPMGVIPTIGGAARDMRSEVGGMTTVTPPNTLTNTPGSATASPAMLDALRQNANKYLSKYEPNGFVGTQEQAAMMPIKSAIIDAIDAANPRRAPGTGGWGAGLEQAGPTAPGYRDYLAEFARRSVPINTMEVAQQLQDTLSGKALDSGGNPLTTLTNYRAALAKALRNSDFAIDPRAQAALEGVQSDLQRATISNSIKSSGSDTAYNAGAGSSFLNALGAGGGSGNGKTAVAGLGTLAATGNPFTAAGAMDAVKKAGGFVSNRVGNSLGDLLLDPQRLAKALTDQLQAQGKAASPAAPAVMGRLTGKLTPAMAAAIALQLQQPNAPQVVAPTGSDAYAK